MNCFQKVQCRILIRHFAKIGAGGSNFSANMIGENGRQALPGSLSDVRDLLAGQDQRKYAEAFLIIVMF
jgi:hypothetical protein